MDHHLQDYSESARIFFRGLSEEIREEFSTSLNEIFRNELVNFQANIAQAFGQSQPVITDFLPGDLFDQPDAIFSAAIRGALQTAISDYFRKGSIDIGRAVQGASRSGGAVLSRSQRKVENWEKKSF